MNENQSPTLDVATLEQRISELGCLYGIEKLVSGEGSGTEVALQGAARIIPNAACRGKDCSVRLQVGDQAYYSDRFKESARRESFPIHIRGEVAGSLDIFLAEQGSTAPFLTEAERELLVTVAYRIGRFVEQWKTEQELRQYTEQLFRDHEERLKAERWLQAVLTLSAAIAGCQTQDEICRMVVEGIRSKMDIDRCGLFLSAPDDPRFCGTYGTDMNGHTTNERYYFWDIRKERDIEDLFADIPFKTGFPLGNPDPQPGEEGICSNLIALRQDGKVFGIISVDNRITHRPVSESQMYHISLLAEVLGNALQIAGTRAELRESIEKAKLANEELASFNQVMVGRENRMIELKEEINQLLAEQGKPPRYPPVWSGAGNNLAGWEPS
jgi:GAF domain-containing protein